MNEATYGDVDSGSDAAPNFLTSLKLVLANKHFLLVLAIILLGYVGMGVSSGAGIYYATYIQGDPALLGPLTMAGLLPVAFVLPFMPQLMSRYGMRWVNIVGLLVICLGNVIAWFGQGSWMVLLAGLAIAGAGGAPFLGSFMAYVAEVADNILMKTGEKIEGMTFSVSSVGIKVGQGLGGAIVGWVLGAASFDGLAETQPDGALTAMAVMFIIAPIVASVIRILAFIPFTVEEENAQLRARVEA